MENYSIVNVGYFKYSLFKSSTKKCVYVEGFADRRRKLPKIVTIPSKIDYGGETYSVFGIMCSAFSNSFAHQPDELIIEEGIEFISQHAFYHAGYKKIVVPKSVCSLGFACFYGNPDISFEGSDFSGITSLNGNLTSIFGSLKPLYSILEQDPEGLGFYLGKVFVGISPNDCRYVDKKLDLHIKEGIENLYLEELVLSSGYNITLPSTIKKVALSKTMCRCDWRVPSLEIWCGISFSGHFNPGVMPFENIYIGDSKEAVKDLIISGTIEYIKDYVFYNYLQIKNIIIKKGVKHIGVSAFQCDHLHRGNSLPVEKIRLPLGLVSIMSEAFRGRKFSGTVDLPPTTSYLGRQCFDGLCGELIIHSMKLVSKCSYEINSFLKNSSLYSIILDPFDISEITMRELYNSLRSILLDTNRVVMPSFVLTDRCLGQLKEYEETVELIDTEGKAVEVRCSSKGIVEQYLPFPIPRCLNIYVNPERKQDFLNHKIYNLLKNNYSLIEGEISHSGSSCLHINLDEDRNVYVVQPKLTTTNLENNYFGWITVPKTYQSKIVEIDPFAFFDCPDVYEIIIPKGYGKNLIINTDINIKEID